jgi:hypothetical protein
VSYVAKQTDTQEGNASAVATEHQPRTERFFELSLVRAEDNVRMALLILLLIVALTSPTYVVSSVTLYTSLVIGVLLTLWTRFAARWGELRAAGHMATASGIVLLAEFAWLALFVHGTGGLTSPFSALLLLPVIFASAFFSLLHIAVALTTGLIVATNVFFAVRYRLDPDTSWHLTGMLLAVIAIAWASYGLCLVLERERRANDLVWSTSSSNASRACPHRRSSLSILFTLQRRPSSVRSPRYCATSWPPRPTIPRTCATSP